MVGEPRYYLFCFFIRFESVLVLKPKTLLKEQIWSQTIPSKITSLCCFMTLQVEVGHHCTSKDLKMLHILQSNHVTGQNFWFFAFYRPTCTGWSEILQTPCTGGLSWINFNGFVFSDMFCSFTVVSIRRVRGSTPRQSERQGHSWKAQKSSIPPPKKTLFVT